MEQTYNSSYIQLHCYICLGEFFMTCFYHPSFSCPILAVSQSMITQRILTGIPPAERPINLTSHNLNLYQINHLIVKKNLLNEKNMASAQNLRESLSERMYSPCPSTPDTFSQSRRTYRDQKEMAELMRHPIAPTAVRPNRCRPVAIPASDPLDKETQMVRLVNKKGPIPNKSV